MNLTVASSSTNPALHPTALWLQNGGLQNGRFYEHPDGSLEILPKSIPEVFGEYVLAPVIETTYTISTRLFQAVKSGFSYFDSAFSQTVQILPVAKASDIVDPAHEKRQSPSCTTLGVLANEIERFNSNAGLIQSPKASFQTPGEAKAYIEGIMGPIAMPQTSCRLDAAFQVIARMKAPSIMEKKELERAYGELQTMVDQDTLRFCEQRIVELLTELSSNTRQYSLSALEPLPKVLAALLRTQGVDYTFAQLDFLTTKINEIACEMVLKYQMTNHNTLLNRWLDVMLTSAEKSTENKEATLRSFTTATKVLQSNPEKVERAEKTRIRSLVRRFQAGSISSHDLVVAEKVLQATGPKLWAIGLLHSYLERLPDDIRHLEEALQDIGGALFKNRATQATFAVPLLTAAIMMPDRAKQALKYSLLMTAALIAINKYVL